MSIYLLSKSLEEILRILWIMSRCSGSLANCRPYVSELRTDDNYWSIKFSRIELISQLLIARKQEELSTGSWPSEKFSDVLRRTNRILPNAPHWEKKELKEPKWWKTMWIKHQGVIIVRVEAFLHSNSVVFSILFFSYLSYSYRIVHISYMFKEAITPDI